MSLQLNRVQVGTTLHVYDDDSVERIHDVVMRALRQGESVVRQGVRAHIDDQPVVDLRARGSNQYTWDKTGNRVLCERELVLRCSKRGGRVSVERIPLGKVYRKYEEVC